MVTTLAAQSRPPVRPAGNPALTDVEMEKAIRDRFAKSKCAQDKFTVRVQGGVATLEGKTDVVQRKGTATRMARTAGARKVVNKIQVSDAAREKASATLATGRRRAQIKRSDAKR
jgi:osmotically-inducible protein OsmY